MADFVRSFRDGVLKIIDGAGTPNEVEVLLSEGDLKIKVAKEVLEIKDRGVLEDIKKGDEMPMEWELSARFTGFEGSSTNVIEAMNKTGGAAAHVSTRSTTDVFCFNVQLELKGVGGAVDETILLPDCFLLEMPVSEGDPSMVSFKGKSWATYPTIS